MRQKSSIIYEVTSDGGGIDIEKEIGHGRLGKY